LKETKAAEGKEFSGSFQMNYLKFVVNHLNALKEFKTPSIIANFLLLRCYFYQRGINMMQCMSLFYHDF
jgi:hypothetical protein